MAMSTIHLFTGENSYDLLLKNQTWVREFIAKHGAENYLHLDVKSFAVREFLDEAGSAPFLAEKRLMVISGLPKMEPEHISTLPNIVHPDTIVVFVEPKPDKRLSSTKAWLKIATVHDHPPLDVRSYPKWIAEYVAFHQGAIQPEASQALLTSVGYDQSLLATELDKLLLYAGSNPITTEHVATMTLCSAEQAAWQLMDLLASNDATTALSFVRDILRRGESPHGLWAQLLWMMSQLIGVSMAVSEGITNPGAIAKVAGVSFPAAKSLLPLAKRLTAQQVAELSQFVCEADIALKTGGYRATNDNEQELLGLIDQVIWTATAS